jgi:hypothetical protein
MAPLGRGQPQTTPVNPTPIAVDEAQVAAIDLLFQLLGDYEMFLALVGGRP